MGKKDDGDITFSRLALFLAKDYAYIYYINMENNHYMKYAADGKAKHLEVLSEGDDFFEYAEGFCSSEVYEEDRQKLLSRINRPILIDAIRENQTITLSYRLLKEGKPVHHLLKCTPGTGIDDKFVIIGVLNVDSETRHEQEMMTQTEIYSQIANAMLGRYEVLYYVDIITDEYIEYSTSPKYATLNLGVRTNSFFSDTRENMRQSIHPDDYAMLSDHMQKGKLLYELSEKDSFSLTYRLLLNGKYEYVNMRAVRPKNDNRHIIIGVTNINEAVIREQEFKDALSLARKDALTGVKNKRAYFDAENDLNKAIEKGEAPSFAIAVCDINDLKKVNDANGHLAGDDYIKQASSIICNIFKHSPVFRIGGDEFVAIMKGEDFENHVTVFEDLRKTIWDNKKHGQVVIASGIAIFDPQIDRSVSDVFLRADRVMYKNKKSLKTVS